MIRLLTFLLGAIFFAALVTALFSLGAAVHVEAFGWQADPPAGVAAAAFAAVLFAVGLVVSLYKDFISMRRRALLRGVLKRRDKGVDALVEAAGAHQRADHRKAGRLAQKASRLLDRDDFLALFAPAPAPVEIEVELEPEPELAAAPQPEPPPEPEPLAAPVAMPAIAPPTEAAPAPEEPPAPTAEEALDRDIAAARRVS